MRLRHTPKDNHPSKPDELQSYDENLTKLAASVKTLESNGDLMQAPPTGPQTVSATDFEDLARLTLRDFIETGNESAETSMSRFQRSEISAAVITASGLIREANEIATTSYGLKAGRTLFECGIEFHGNDQFARQISELEATDAKEQSFGLLQVFGGKGFGVLTMVISRVETSEEGERRFLILCAAKQYQDTAIDLLASKFNLSPAEAEIAKAFARGTSLRQIAADRGRSYTTIRNQFQTVLEKTECGSQSDLLQFATSLSTLFANAKTILRPPTATLTGALHIPRPHGRQMEVLINGDRDGTPVVNLFSLFGPGITPTIDNQLKQRGICLISPWRPGFSETSKPLKNVPRAVCLAADVTALLDSLEIERCAWLARASSSQTFYDTAILMPERITHGVVVNGLVPRKYISGKSVASKWTNVLMGASIVSYPVARMILGAGEQLMRRSDTVSFLQKMYDHSQTDKIALGDPVTAASILEGVQGVVRQGLDSGVEDIVSGFAAWDTDLDALKVPVTLYHGFDDPNVPFDGVVEFARDHSTVMTLVSEQGGGQLCYSHFDRVLDLLMDDPSPTVANM